MNTMKRLFWIVSATVLLTAVSCSSDQEAKTEDTKKDSLQVVPVKTMIVKNEMVTLNIDYTATLVPFEEVHLAPSTPGRIEKINVEIGDPVSQGEVVALMDRTNLEQARINLMKLETDFRRLDTLKKTRSIADQQYDQIKSAYDIAKNSYEFLLQNTQLKAPFTGIVSGKYFEDGEIYSGTPVATVGKPAIISLVQISQLKALIGITANYYPMVRTGMKAEITSEVYPGLVFSGAIYRVYPTIDNATKTFTVEVKILNPNLKLRPGMFAKIRLDLGKGNAILVPNIALIKQTGTDDMYAFLNRNGVAEKVAVRTGRMIDDRIEILDGLKDGDELVVIGQNKLENKSRLSIQK